MQAPYHHRDISYSDSSTLHTRLHDSWLQACSLCLVLKHSTSLSTGVVLIVWCVELFSLLDAHCVDHEILPHTCDDLRTMVELRYHTHVLIIAYACFYMLSFLLTRMLCFAYRVTLALIEKFYWENYSCKIIFSVKLQSHSWTIRT